MEIAQGVCHYGANKLGMMDSNFGVLGLKSRI